MPAGFSADLPIHPHILSALWLLRRHATLFECLELELPWNNYTQPLTAWLAAFPREQIMLLQYETLTDPAYEAAQLKAVKM